MCASQAEDDEGFNLLVEEETRAAIFNWAFSINHETIKKLNFDKNSSSIKLDLGSMVINLASHIVDLGEDVILDASKS